MTPLTFRPGRMIRVTPQNVSNMSGLHFQMQYVRLARESRASRKVHKTPDFIALDGSIRVRIDRAGFCARQGRFRKIVRITPLRAIRVVL